MARGNLHPKPGPGIPKGYKYPSTVLREKAKDILYQQIYGNWKSIIGVLVKAAVKDKDPDAAKTLIEFLSGKASQTIEGNADFTGGAMQKMADAVDAYMKRK